MSKVIVRTRSDGAEFSIDGGVTWHIVYGETEWEIEQAIIEQASPMIARKEALEGRQSRIEHNVNRRLQIPVKRFN